MRTITVRTCGDRWLNQQQVEQQLSNIVDQKQYICFDTGAEGISLKYSGILKFIDQWAEQVGYPVERVFINSPNIYEKTQYKNIYPATSNHFFGLSGHYRTAVPPIVSTTSKFGFFVGRHTEYRNQMINDVIENYNEHFILSVMKSRFNNSPWTGKANVVPSIDDKFVRDQYTGDTDTNLSLLQYYNRFQIELVAETMCLGETFFPTEKTVRPLLAGRPFLIFGPKNFLQNLRQLGFQTYSLCWNEQYDLLDGYDRWNSIKVVINDIIKGYDIATAQKIALHNQEHLKYWHRFIPRKIYPE